MCPDLGGIYMKIDYTNKPESSLENLLEKFSLDTFLIIEDVLSGSKSYAFILQQLIDIMKWGFEIDEIRHRPIHFKFHKSDKEIRQLPLNNFISNLILWYSFMEMDRMDLLTDDVIYDFTKQYPEGLVENICRFLDDKVLPYFEGDFYSRNKCIDEIFHNMRAISRAFCLLMGMSISLYDIWQAEKQCPEITDIIFGKIDTTLQPKEIEVELDRRASRLIELFSQVDCDMKPLLVSGKNISTGQFKEMFVMIGLKTDNQGVVIPMVLDTNLVVGGNSKPSYLYIGATSGRKALILTKKRMGDPGAFSKRINHLATSPGILRPDYEDCNSIQTITYHIRDDAFLELLDNRYYYDERGNLQLLRYSKDKHLIGKCVNFSSPATCNSHEGICKKCYGELFEMNHDLFSVGSFAATKSTNPLGQKVLSSKHYRGSDSVTIQFQDDFNDIFELDSANVSVSDNPKMDTEELFIVLNHVFMEENDDTTDFYVEEFDVIDKKGKNLYHVAEDNGAKLYFSDALRQHYLKMRNKMSPIPLDDIVDADDSILFGIETKSKELTDPIRMVEHVLSKKNTSTHTISEICQMMAENFMEFGIHINLVHLETIIRALVRKKSNLHEYPDWSRNGDPNDYTILTIDAGFKKNPSALVTMTYGYLKQMLTSPDFYEKTAPSHLDALFARNLNMYME